MKQNRGPEIKPHTLWSINLWQRRQEKTVFSISVAEKTGHGKKNEIRTFSHIVYKNLKWSKDINLRSEPIKLEEEVVEYSFM